MSHGNRTIPFGIVKVIGVVGIGWGGFGSMFQLSWPRCGGPYGSLVLWFGLYPSAGLELMLFVLRRKLQKCWCGIESFYWSVVYNRGTGVLGT